MIGDPLTFPHCDSSIVHSPKAGCKYCNDRSDLQAIREAWGINFTGEYDPEKIICPSEQRRPLEIINKWVGNRINGE